jgi:hypothetical protein
MFTDAFKLAINNNGVNEMSFSTEIYEEIFRMIFNASVM